VPRIDVKEDEEHEFKENWTEKDRALEDIAAFSNGKGGILFIGIDDDGEIIGYEIDDKEYQRITSKIVDNLGIHPSVEPVTMQGVPILKITVKPAQRLVRHNRRYYARVGSTNREMTEDEMASRLLQTAGQSWDSQLTQLGIDAVDNALIDRFRKLAQNRLPYISSSETKYILENLSLLQEGRLTNAAAIFFTSIPQKLFPQAEIQIARFQGETGTIIIDSAILSGSIWEQIDETLSRLRQMLKVRFEIDVEEANLQGLQRQEVWDYPLDALREAILNAIAHRDYAASGKIQIRIYDDRLMIWNPGRLPGSLHIDQLYKEGHPSIPRNPLLARILYDAGLIETWGTGTLRIIELFSKRGLPRPRFVEDGNGFIVELFQDPYTLDVLQNKGLSERQIEAVVYTKKNGKITNKDYRQLTQLSDEAARQDLGELVEKGILKSQGRGRGTHYVLKRQ
jgi:ATP-dependent DNA helicase RecG